MKTKQVEELVLQSLEHEIGGIEVYTVAVGCAVKTAIGAARAEQSAEKQRHH